MQFGIGVKIRTHETIQAGEQDFLAMIAHAAQFSYIED
jgi:hypothetical protein